jgi:hypothetical protein
MFKIHVGTTPPRYINTKTNVANIYLSALKLRDSITGGLSGNLSAAGVVMLGACGLRTRCAPPLHWKCAAPGNQASLRTHSGRTGGDNVIRLRALAIELPVRRALRAVGAFNHPLPLGAFKHPVLMTGASTQFGRSKEQALDSRIPGVTRVSARDGRPG